MSEEHQSYLKTNIGGEEKEFASQEELVAFIQDREQRAMDLQRQLEDLNGRMASFEDLKRLGDFIESVPESKDYLRDMWEKTQGGTVPLAQPPKAAPGTPAPSGGAADEISQIIARMEQADDFDGMRDANRSAFTAVLNELRNTKEQLREIQERVVPAVAAISEREQGQMIVQQYYKTMDTFKEDPRFKDLTEKDWTLIDKHLTMADVSPDQFREAFEDEAKTMLEYRNEILAGMSRRGSVRSPGELPGPFPFPQGGSAQMGNQGGNNPTPKDRDEWRQRMAEAVISEKLGGTEGV